MDGAVAEHLLHVEGDEEEHREQRGADQDPDDVGAGQGADAEDREGDERFPRALLDDDERGEEDQGYGDQRQGFRRPPTRGVRVDHRIDEERERCRHRDSAGDVEGPRLVCGAAFHDQPRRQGEGDQADGYVHPEHPFPPEAVGEDAAEEDSGGAAGPRDRPPDAQCFVALRAVFEGRCHDRERGGGDDGRPEALRGAGSDQLPFGRRESGGQGGDRHQEQSAHEHPPASEQVGHAATEQQEAAEGEDVGVDDPGEVLL